MTTTYSEELMQLYQSVNIGPHIVFWAGDGEAEQVYAPAHAMGQRFDYVESFIRVRAGIIFDFRRAIGGDTLPGYKWLFFDEPHISLFIDLADMFLTSTAKP